MKTQLLLFFTLIQFLNIQFINGQDQELDLGLEKGQLITSNQDTINVFINYSRHNVNKNKFSYFLYQQSNKTEMDLSEFNSFSSDVRYLKKITIKEGGIEKPIIAEKILTGFYTLYKVKDKFNNYEYIIETNNNDYELLTALNFELKLENLGILNCQDREVTDKQIYSEAYLKNVLSSYNACKQPDKYVSVEYKNKAKIVAGVKLGINRSKIYGNGLSEFDIVTNGLALNYGIFLDVNKDPRIGFRLEIQYQDRSTSNQNIDLNLGIIQTAFLLKYNLLEKNNLGIMFGPALNIAGVGQEKTADGSENSLNLVFGYVVGVNYGIIFKNGRKINLDLKFDSFSMKNIFETVPQPQFYNNALLFSIEVPLSYTN